MSDDILYDWDTDGRLDDWKLEGPGELIKDPDGALHIRTYNNGPLWRASTAWLRNLELPPDYEVTWTYRNGSETDARITTEGVMILFNALPLALKNLFEDPRLSGRYSDICSYGKMVCYSCGFYRTVYGQAGQLRKLGGHVPASWGESNWVAEDGRSFDDVSILNRADEPLDSESAGKEVAFRLIRTGSRIQIFCNGTIVHDIQDTDLYPYYPDSLKGGHMAFRNFNGYIDSYYRQITVRKL